MSKNPKNNKSRASAVIKRLRLNNFTFPQIIRGVVADQKASAVSSAAFSFFLNYPSYYRNDGGTIAQTTYVCTILANEQKTVDEYKVLELRLSYLPFLQNSLMVASYTTAAGNSGVTDVAPAWDPSMSVSLDLDDSGNLTSQGKALNSQAIGMHTRTGQSLKTLMTFPQVDPIEKMKWLNLQGIVPNVTTPPDPNNPSKLASIKVYTGLVTTGSAYPLANTTIGGFIAEWVCYMRGTYTLS